MQTDLTVGNPSKVLWRFCLPMFASIVFQQLYNLADSLVAGRFIGETALAAVGNSYEVTLIYLAFAFGCNMGCSVILSQLFGAKDIPQMKTAVTTALISSGVVCALLMLAGLLSCEALLTLIRTPGETMADSALYLRIYTFGLPFLFYYNISTGIFTALGDSRTPFYFLSASSVANILMDILFVTRFGMGVDGVAWATFICQGISCILAMIVVLKRLAGFKTEGSVPLFSGALLKKMSAIAIPSTLQQSFISVGNVVIQGIINGFGSGVMAGYAAAIKLNNLVITSFTTVGNGISNYSAQNLGAKKPDRIRQGLTAGLRLIWTLCVPMTVCYLLANRTLLGLFMKDPTEAAMQTGVHILMILSPFYFVVAAKLVSDGILRGIGRMNEFMIGTFSDLILRVTLAYLLSRTALGSDGIWISWPIGWTISAILSLIFSRRAVKDQGAA